MSRFVMLWVVSALSELAGRYLRQQAPTPGREQQEQRGVPNAPQAGLRTA